MAEKTVSEKRMSFLPEDYVERQIERRTTVICLAMFAVVLGGVIGVHVFKMNHLKEAQGRLREVNASYAEAAKRIEQVEALQQQRNEMLRKAQVTATLLERVPRSFLLADLVNRMPEPLSLLELSLTSKLVQPPKPAPTKSALANAKNQAQKNGKKEEKEEEPLPQQAVSLAMVGVAPTDVQVAQYIAKLTQSPLLSDVSLVFSEETKVGEMMLRKFRIEMTLSPTADVRALDPSLRKPDRPRDPLEDTTDGLPQVGVPPAGGAAPASSRASTQ